MTVSLPELAAAAKAAEGSLIKIEIDRQPQKPAPFMVRDVVNDKIIKRFRSYETPLHVNAWIDTKFSAGVFLTSSTFKDKHVLRFKRSIWTFEVWRRAVEKAA